MKITLEGILGRVFEGYTCLRGFASFEDIKNISEPKEYQRGEIKEHTREISKYYEGGGRLFFPEIILSCSICDYEKYKKLTEHENINEQGVDFKVFKKDDAKLTIDTDSIKLSRVDGNHRLKADAPLSILNQKIPFCVLFVNETQSKVDEKIIFHNINFKNKPLHLEKILENILDKEFEKDFPPDSIKETFGKTYSKTKEVLEYLKDSKEFLKEMTPNFRTICYKTVECLDSLLKNPSSKNIAKAMKEVLFENRNNLDKIDSGLFIAFVYYQVLDFKNPQDKKYELFLNWIQKNNLDKIRNITTSDIVNIFNQIQENKKRQIFVSMPFGKPKCENIFYLIENVVKTISEEYNITIPPLKRVDIVDEADSFKIINEIETGIEQSGCLIAILNQQKPNVYHEIGYAMGYYRAKKLDNAVILVLEEPENIRDLNKPEYKVEFNLAGYNQLRFKEFDDFEEQLKDRLLSNFGLKQ